MASEGSNLPPPAPQPAPLLRRSRDDRVIAGVSGGLGRYLGIDSVVIRLAFVVLALFGGSGIVAYIVAWVVIPEEQAGQRPSSAPKSTWASGSLVVGTLLVAVGGILLLDQVIPRFRSLLGPLLLIAIGLVVLARVRR